MAWWKAIVWLLAEFERCYTTQWSVQPIPHFHSHHCCSCPHAVGVIQLQGVGWALIELGVILCLLFSSKHCQAASSLEKIFMVSYSFWQGDFEKSHRDHLIGIHIDNYNGVADKFSHFISCGWWWIFNIAVTDMCIIWCDLAWSECSSPTCAIFPQTNIGLLITLSFQRLCICIIYMLLWMYVYRQY